MDDKDNIMSADLECKLKIRRQQKKKKQRLCMTAGIAAVLLVGVVTVILVAVPLLERTPADENAREMTEKTAAGEALTREDLQADLQRQADESSFRVQLNTAPVSKDGQTADWCIMNNPSNGYDMQVVISTADGSELYSSEVLAPGGEVLVGSIEGGLPDGSYPAAAVAYAIDRETGQKAGEVTVDITVTVGPS